MTRWCWGAGDWRKATRKTKAENLKNKFSNCVFEISEYFVSISNKMIMKDFGDSSSDCQEQGPGFDPNTHGFLSTTIGYGPGDPQQIPIWSWWLTSTDNLNTFEYGSYVYIQMALGILTLALTSLEPRVSLPRALQFYLGLLLKLWPTTLKLCLVSRRTCPGNRQKCL